jgi:AraC-like DNA-binding protein
MKVIFSTEGLRDRDRFDFWHAAARQHVVDHDSEPTRRLDFAAALAAGSLEEIKVFRCDTSAMSVLHSYRHVADLASDELILCRLLAGVVGFEHAGNDVILQPGDMTLLDPQLPYHGRFNQDTSLLVFKVPRARLESRVGQGRSVAGHLMRRDVGEFGLVSDFLSLLPMHTGRLVSSAPTVAEQTLDLMALALAQARGTTTTDVSGARFVVLMRLRAAIERRLSDPELDPATVAAAAGVSVRYANAVLAEEGTSLARLIRHSRLERCRLALGDPGHQHRSIQDIAYHWGFADMTHFGRAFRAAYGVLPRDYRSLQLLLKRP